MSHLLPAVRIARLSAGDNEKQLVGGELSRTDPIADFITVLRNGVRAGRTEVTFPHSRMNESIARLLGREGFIERVEVTNQTGKRRFRRKWLRVHLRYFDELRRDSPLSHIGRVSKPGLRVYRGHKELPPVRGGSGVRIVSTSQGVITDIEARRRGIGGEVLVEVW